MNTVAVKAWAAHWLAEHRQRQAASRAAAVAKRASDAWWSAHWNAVLNPRTPEQYRYAAHHYGMSLSDFMTMQAMRAAQQTQANTAAIAATSYAAALSGAQTAQNTRETAKWAKKTAFRTRWF